MSGIRMETVTELLRSRSEIVRPDSELFPDANEVEAKDKNQEKAVAKETADLMERYYEDAIEDPTMNTQPLEIYLYYAAIERQREAADTRPIPDSPWTVLWKRLTGKKAQVAENSIVPQLVAAATTEGSGEKETTPEQVQILVTPEESKTAYRLLRVASWQAVFFLITTDVLGWYTAPMAFAQLGFGPGVLVYTSFYVLAFASGQMLWRMYLTMDSEKYPVKCYADIGERTYGPVVKHVFNFLQSIQLVFNVAMIVIMEGQALAQIISFKFCYMALTLFFTLFGMALAQGKTLRSLAFFTNMNLWVNLITMMLTMVGVALYDPIPPQSGHADMSEPIRTSGWVPPTTVGWYQQVVGVQLAVYAYGGAMVFTEFMAEMRRPADFWKAALGAQMCCWLLYMMFGMFVYAYQGQYTAILPTINIASLTFQLLTNICSLLCIAVVATLYAHMGCKVFYRNVMRGYFRAPSLTSAKSSLYWSATVCGYYVFAWVIGSAIPNITNLNTIVGAACVLQFTYTFPPLLLVGHWVQRDAIDGDKAWEPGMAAWSTRADSWRDGSRWKRGFRKYWYAKAALLLMALGCLALCGLGLYSGIMTAKAAFAQGYMTSYSCRAPGQPQ